MNVYFECFKNGKAHTFNCYQHSQFCSNSKLGRTVLRGKNYGCGSQNEEAFSNRPCVVKELTDIEERSQGEQAILIAFALSYKGLKI